MKRLPNFPESVLILFLVLVTGCSPATPIVPATSTVEIPQSPILTLKGPNGGRIFSLAELQDLPVSTGQAGIKSSTGQITIPEEFTGVALKDLVKYLGVPFDETFGVVITAEDGYSMTFSYAQVMNGDFIAYDPALGNELVEHDPLSVILAYMHNGQPLNAVEEGHLRIAVISETNNQVVDGHWSVKWVNKVEVSPVGSTWTLDMEGAIASSVSRDSFQSCGSPGCHGVSWKDADGQDWVGVPLWLMIGEVDDNDSHSDVAYNRALAEAGYSTDIIASDGYTVTLDSAISHLNNQILIAHLVNEGDLPEKYYPLRLVGEGLEKSQMVGQINKIVVDVATFPTDSPTSVPENSGRIDIKGLVNRELTLSDSDLRNLVIVTISAAGTDGPQDFTGVKLNQLLDMAVIQENAQKITFTSADGYTAEVDLIEVRDCPNALLAFMDTPGMYLIVLPDSPTSTWVKAVSIIEIN